MKPIHVALPLDIAEHFIRLAAVDLIRARVAMDCPEYCWNAPWPAKGKAAWIEHNKQAETERRAIATLRAFGIEDYPFPNATDVFQMHKADPARKIKPAPIWNSELRAKAANDIAAEMVAVWKAAQP